MRWKEVSGAGGAATGQAGVQACCLHPSRVCRAGTGVYGRRPPPPHDDGSGGVTPPPLFQAPLGALGSHSPRHCCRCDFSYVARRTRARARSTQPLQNPLHRRVQIALRRPTDPPPGRRDRPTPRHFHPHALHRSRSSVSSPVPPSASCFPLRQPPRVAAGSRRLSRVAAMAPALCFTPSAGTGLRGAAALAGSSVRARPLLRVRWCVLLRLFVCRLRCCA